MSDDDKRWDDRTDRMTSVPINNTFSTHANTNSATHAHDTFRVLRQSLEAHPAASQLRLPHNPRQHRAQPSHLLHVQHALPP
jgi:hypothetical protein